MEDTQIEDYKNEHLSLVNINPTCGNLDIIDTKISVAESKRVAAFEARNETQETEFWKQTMQSETYNKIIELGGLTECYFHFDQQIADTVGEEEKRNVMQMKLDKRAFLKQKLEEDFFCKRLVSLMQFCLH